MLIGSICGVLLAASPNAQLAQAEELVSSVRYADAEKALAVAWTVPNNSRPTVLRILELRGIVNAVLGQPKATTYFVQLLTLDPGHRLAEGQSPRVRTPFYEAKGLVADAAEMQLRASAAVVGNKVKLSATLSADPQKLARKIRFHVRTNRAAWKPTDVPVTNLTAQLDAGAGKVEWWAQLLGENDSALLEAGGAEQPSAIEAIEPPAPVPAKVIAKAPEPSVEPAAPAVAASAPEAPSRPVLLPALLLGGAAAVAICGGVMGLLSSSSFAQVDNAPKDSAGTFTTLTQRQAGELRANGRTQAIAANVLFGAAGAIALTGVLVFSLSSPAKVTIAPTPGGLVFAGQLP